MQAPPYRRSNTSKHLSLRSVRLWHCIAAVLLTAAASLGWLQWRAAERLPFSTHHRSFALDDVVTDETFYLDDGLVHQLVQQCMQQQDTFLWLRQGPDGSKQVESWNDQQLHLRPAQLSDSCGLFHIPLAASDRSIGLCTDAALYVQLLGGWVVPATQHGLAHAQSCGVRSAVLFLEPLYDLWLDWLVQQPHVVAVYAPNFEQVFGYDVTSHQRMRLILCKVQRCRDLMEKYLEDIHSTATLMYTGHTSVDFQALPQHLLTMQPSVAGSSSIRRHLPTPQQQPAAAAHKPPIRLAAAAQPLSVLHVRGKSGLKHTKQLLDCWVQYPQWPQLTVIGPMPNEQVSGADAKRFLAAPNIRVPNPGKQQGPNWPEFEPLPAGELSALLLSHAVHIMPSEREGFGHSINEGRAAGAVLLVPDHPPMSELVREGSGILLRPHHTFSHEDAPVPALGKYGNISASMSAESICDGVAQVLAKGPAELAAMGRQARGLFESDRAAFVDNMKDVVEELRDLLGVAEAAAKLDA